ncbi:hypothetical protein SAMN04515692_103202 [Leifsonia sp. CL147]|nr:hypothetical protein SAMN04515694_103201 [Leifsonia sp. CL154]SFL36975.1 hypothetical protein SAMN04515692_103202 [Leifsonia sp. CL147]
MTLWFSTMAVIATALLIVRAMSMGRLVRAAKSHPEALVLEGVRLNLTVARLRMLVDDGVRTGGHRGTNLKLPFWFPLVITGGAILITTNDGKTITLERENIQTITTEFTSVDVGSGHTRSASLIDIALNDPELVIPLAVRSTRWNAFFRLTANAKDTAIVRKELAERLDPVRL